MIICRPWITTRDGRRIHAEDYGKDAFCFEVEQERPATEEKEKLPADTSS